MMKEKKFDLQERFIDYAVEYAVCPVREEVHFFIVSFRNAVVQ